MNAIPPAPRSRLFEAALEIRSGRDTQSQERDTLRASLAQVRRDSGLLADRISHDLPEFTIHDGSHLDALWPLVDEIGAADLELTPPEAWVLGVAILLHDLGMAVAAYPGGKEELRRAPEWPDARAAALRSDLGHPPSAAELAAENEGLDLRADAVVLRKRHAERAGELVNARWDEHRLVENSSLRNALGTTAGRIAASHWWPVSRLAELGDTEGAPGGMPRDWTVRPILLAVLLRLADGAHLDESRAPRFARALRRLGSTADSHWDFQERLRQPVLEEDALRFVSSQSFPADKASSWWLCFEQLNQLDDDLRTCDGLLRARGLPRLAARSVQGARDPSALAALIRPVGWEPVDARVEVSDLSRMIRRLGGHALYGSAQAVPLRELIQNACDAIAARGSQQEGFRGRVTVRLSANLRELTVEDNGIGMPQEVLTGALLDFGRSLWESEELATVLPGLQAAGFQPIGRFGIGFFSVFMWADEVTVFTRSKEFGDGQTTVLDFVRGLDGRPLVRTAAPGERLSDAGTAVRLRLREGEWDLPGLLGVTEGDVEQGEADLTPVAELLPTLLRWLAPALGADLYAAYGENPPARVLEGGDWTTLPARELLDRVLYKGGADKFPESVVARVAPIGSPESPVGRAALPAGLRLWMGGDPGVLVAGGLRVDGTSAFAGLLFVDDVDASRGHGTSIATPDNVAEWATRQAVLAPNSHGEGRALASAILELGGDAGGLPLANSAAGFLNRDEIVSWARARDRIILVNVESELNNAGDYQWIPHDPRVTIIENDVLDYAESLSSYVRSRLRFDGRNGKPPKELVEEAIGEAWGVDELEGVEVESEGLIEVDEADPVPCIGYEFVRPIELDWEGATDQG